MSGSFLAAAAVRTSDSDSTEGSSNPRQKVTQLSEKVVDTNPYSRLMYAAFHVKNSLAPEPMHSLTTRVDMYARVM